MILFNLRSVIDKIDTSSSFPAYCSPTETPRGHCMEVTSVDRLGLGDLFELTVKVMSFDGLVICILRRMNAARCKTQDGLKEKDSFDGA